jgi:catechol 2,3-dioxygenase-like lactoylglutathione lyase family enzyme
MPLLKLEHYLVLSDDIDKTRDFYRDVLGMREGFRPKLDFPGYWLYVGDVPSIHIAEWKSYAAWTKEVGIPVSSRAPSTGSVDHIAFNASGFDEVRARLQSRGIEINENLIDEIGLRQLFIHDPNGVPIELNFRS